MQRIATKVPECIECNSENEFTKLLEEVRHCRICMDDPDGKKLPHEPRPVLRASSVARLCICGQAPGVRVHKSGIPFTDPSGDRLRNWMGVGESEFYDETKIAIIPMGFCFPGLNKKGGDLPPRKECAKRWRDKIFSNLTNLDLVLLVGQYAQRWHLEDQCKANLTETVKSWKYYISSDATPRFLPLPHPSWRNNAWLKRNTWFEDEVLPFLRKEVQNLICC